MAATLKKSKAPNVLVKLGSTHRNRLTEATDCYIDSEKAGQAILKKVDESISHYEATGLHITLDEVKIWAKEVQINRDALLPAGHT
jgi:hypothetical protein